MSRFGVSNRAAQRVGRGGGQCHTNKERDIISEERSRPAVPVRYRAGLLLLLFSGLLLFGRAGGVGQTRVLSGMIRIDGEEGGSMVSVER